MEDAQRKNDSDHFSSGAHQRSGRGMKARLFTAGVLGLAAMGRIPGADATPVKERGLENDPVDAFSPVMPRDALVGDFGPAAAVAAALVEPRQAVDRTRTI